MAPTIENANIVRRDCERSDGGRRPWQEFRERGCRIVRCKYVDRCLTPLRKMETFAVVLDFETSKHL